MIRLTDFETGKTVFVNKDKIDLISQLPASICVFGNMTTEIAERTKIQIGSEIFLVRETPEDIMQDST